MEDIKKSLTVLNNALLTKTFLVGERVTLADISVACNLLMLYKQVSFSSLNYEFTDVIKPYFSQCFSFNVQVAKTVEALLATTLVSDQLQSRPTL